jgi:hypothetical protein
VFTSVCQLKLTLLLATNVSFTVTSSLNVDLSANVEYHATFNVFKLDIQLTDTFLSNAALPLAFNCQFNVVTFSTFKLRVFVAPATLTSVLASISVLNVFVQLNVASQFDINASVTVALVAVRLVTLSSVAVNVSIVDLLTVSDVI